MAASLLLDYPGSDFIQRAQSVASESEGFPQPIARSLSAFCRWVKKVGLRSVEETYVATFDERRRCALELSYYAVGDTRQRGQALLAFRELYKGAGFEQCSGELPDYLPAILELCAKSDDPAVVNILPSHRSALEVLRTALFQLDSPWTDVLTALCHALPAIDEETKNRYQQLIRQGPPTELVGITDLPFPVLAEVRS
ncbi:MAG: nitrate reductase molybdenum cofactor assembly chaperone [Ancrocorticia sp.]|uniref:nitrate reductase molybdenum cofactor assembly chaperone n=1 Tax=Ancrocorticia sp. TaxID=2593684 RepID=UPI003F917BF4